MKTAFIWAIPVFLATVAYKNIFPYGIKPLAIFPGGQLNYMLLHPPSNWQGYFTPKLLAFQLTSFLFYFVYIYVLNHKFRQ